MSFEHILVIVSVFVSLSGSVAYVADTLKGKTKPNRISWLLWAAAPLIGTGAAISSGADAWATARIFLAGLVPLIVLVVSLINKQSYWKLTALDFACGICSALALIVWFFADSPVLAVLLAATGDGLASLPTLIKSWKYPETETGWTYLAGLIATLLVLPSIPAWNIQNSAFQIYLLVVNSLLVLFIFRKKIKI
jgi:hypothetical protein